MTQPALWENDEHAPPSVDSGSGRGGRLPSTAVSPVALIVVHGIPAPQGSKKGWAIRDRDGKPTGQVAMKEQNKTRIDQWRGDVVRACQDYISAAVNGEPGTYADRARMMNSWTPLDGPLELSAVFTLRDKPASRPKWWPDGEPWNRHMWWRPAGMPDLDKLARSTMDALKTAGVIKDDARIVGFPEPFGKWYCGDPGQPDALTVPGAVLRIRRAS